MLNFPALKLKNAINLCIKSVKRQLKEFFICDSYGLLYWLKAVFWRKNLGIISTWDEKDFTEDEIESTQGQTEHWKTRETWEIGETWKTQNSSFPMFGWIWPPLDKLDLVWVQSDLPCVTSHGLTRMQRVTKMIFYVCLFLLFSVCLFIGTVERWVPETAVRKSWVRCARVERRSCTPGPWTPRTSSFPRVRQSASLSFVNASNCKTQYWKLQ